MITENQILKCIKSKKSNRECAKKLGISVDDYLNKKRFFINKTIDNLEKNSYIIALEEKIIEFSENLTNGTAKIKGIALSEPKSAEEIEQILKIDKTKWKLSSYWNKQHKNNNKEYWVVSAMVTKRQESEMSIEEAEELVKKIFTKSNITPFTKQQSSVVNNKKALFVYTSDKHIAAYVCGEESMYENEYNFNVFNSRMLTVMYEIQYLYGLYGKFSDIYVIDLGDRMDGMNAQTTRGGHKLPQNMNDKEAFEAVISGEKKFYDVLFTNDYASQYHVISNACSNHGGVFDYIVSRALEIYINAKYPTVNTLIQERFIDHIEYGKHVFLLTHGKDTEDMKHGLPLHLNDKTENYINKYLMYNKIDTSNKYVSVVKGDLHKNTSELTYGFRYRNVLSLFGGSKWISTNFGPTKPGCSFDIVEKDTDRIYEHKILF
jgi:hypothetical protein